MEYLGEDTSSQMIFSYMELKTHFVAILAPSPLLFPCRSGVSHIMGSLRELDTGRQPPLSSYWGTCWPEKTQSCTQSTGKTETFSWRWTCWCSSWEKFNLENCQYQEVIERSSSPWRASLPMLAPYDELCLINKEMSSEKAVGTVRCRCKTVPLIS